MQSSDSLLWQYKSSPAIRSLYNRFFTISQNISPLAAWTLMYPQFLSGAALFNFGRLMNLKSGWTNVAKAMIWQYDPWTQINSNGEPEIPDQVSYWNGTLGAVSNDSYRRYIQAKLLTSGRPFSINTIKIWLDTLFEGTFYNAAIYEALYWGDTSESTDGLTPMRFKLSINGDAARIRSIIEIVSFDPQPLGKPIGINYMLDLQPIDVQQDTADYQEVKDLGFDPNSDFQQVEDENFDFSADFQETEQPTN